jgi:hypothetical protein
MLEWLSVPRQYFDSPNDYATLPSVENAREWDVLLSLQGRTITFADFARKNSLEMRSTPTTVHRTHEAKNFVVLPKGRDHRLQIWSKTEVLTVGALLHEGATFSRFDDTWAEPPCYALAPERVTAMDRYSSSIGHYRLVMRAIVGTSPHKAIATLIPPGTLAANSALIEGTPALRPSYKALVTVAILNSSVASFLLSLSADLNVNLFALRRVAWPLNIQERFLAHSALRLLANHAGFAPLVSEQLGESHFCAGAGPFPFVAIPDERRRIHGQMDATIAYAFGLSRMDYETVLSRFRKDNTFAEALSAFDEICTIGVETYAKQYDPYFDVPVVTTMPKSIINLNDASLEPTVTSSP